MVESQFPVFIEAYLVVFGGALAIFILENVSKRQIQEICQEPEPFLRFIVRLFAIDLLLDKICYRGKIVQNRRFLAINIQSYLS